MLPIGIDFGTTKSSIGVSFQGQVEIIQNEQGSTYIPSCVAFTDCALLVGAPALDQITANIANTVIGIKRVLGREFDNNELKSYFESSAVKIEKGNDNLPKFDVEYLSTRKQVCIEEAASFIISKLKDIAENYLKVNGSHMVDVEHAAIAVPMNFTGTQRQALKEAATIAGVKAHLISEPIAAAIACGIYEKYNRAKRNVLVFDIGGGKTEATILTVERKEHRETYSVKGSVANFNIGGCDFDRLLIKHFKSELNLSLRDKRDVERLRKACESIRQQLSLLKRARVETYLEGNECNIALTRTKLEDLCSKMFKKAIDLVHHAWNIAKTDTIHDVVLTGGCTRIPMIREMFFKLFPDVAVETINPDEAVVRGAAAYAEIILRGQEVDMNEILLKQIWTYTEDVGPVNSSTGSRHVIIADIGTQLPFETKVPISIQRRQRVNGINVRVDQGDTSRPENSELVANISIQSCQKESFNVVFQIDEDRRLTVCEEDASSGTCKINPITAGLTQVRNDV